jgi:hypothetical protein
VQFFGDDPFLLPLLPFLPVQHVDQFQLFLLHFLQEFHLLFQVFVLVGLLLSFLFDNGEQLLPLLLEFGFLPVQVQVDFVVQALPHLPHVLLEFHVAVTLSLYFVLEPVHSQVSFLYFGLIQLFLVLFYCRCEL